MKTYPPTPYFDTDRDGQGAIARGVGLTQTEGVVFVRIQQM